VKVQRVMIGTAGHIDHGKSSLVRALTGVNPDQLKEEKERGLTIDMGRAVLDLPDGRKAGVIDVPGHEKFIKNMVAGAVSVAVALLVIAADDGVMPQTREHLEILTLLGVRKCLVALTKVDLVDPELRELAVEEIDSFLEGTPYAGSPIIPVSSVTGEGIEEVRRGLVRLVMETPPPPPDGFFRLPVQRIFRKEGFGSVLGGVPVAGKARKGDLLEVLPGGYRGRVRGIQVYGSPSEEALPGHSCALNIPDVPMGQVKRGAWVATPGVFQVHDRLLAGLKILPSAKPLKSGADIRFHVGTAEIQGRVFLPGGGSLAPGDSGLGRIRLAHPTLLVPGDSFILRLQAPPRTIGGGRIVLPGWGGRRLKGEWARLVEAMDRALEKRDPAAFLAEQIRGAGFHPLEPGDLAPLAARPAKEVEEILEELARRGEAVKVGKGYLSPGALEKVRKKILQELEEHARRDALSPEVGKAEILSSLGIPQPVMETVLEEMAAKEEVRFLPGGLLALPGGEGALDEEAKEKEEALLSLLEGAGHQPLTEEEARRASGIEPSLFQSLVRRLQSRGRIVRVAGKFLYHGGPYKVAREVLIENCKAGGSLDIPAFRDRLGTTRKYLIPLLEHFDGIGLTARRGSNRVLRDETAGAP